MRRSMRLTGVLMLALVACSDSPTGFVAPSPDGPGMLLVATGGPFTQVSAGSLHSCGLESDGSIACWGNNDFMQLSNAPTGTGFKQVSAGGGHSCALEADGSIDCWGSAAQIANTPMDDGFTQLSAAPSFTCALKNDGSITCWGANDGGQVSGAPSTADFTQVSAGSAVSSAAHGCALKGDGSIVCWGADASGSVSGPNAAGTGFTQVSAGANNTCAVKADGSIACWGNDSDGQVSGPAAAGTGFAEVITGSRYTCALGTDGSIACWGYNASGQVGNAPAGTGYTSLSGFFAHSCAIRPNGLPVCWGLNNAGQVSGVPTTTILPTATFVAPASVVEAGGFTLSLTGATVPGYAGPVTFTYAFDCGDGSGYGAFAATSSVPCTAPATGPITVKGTVKDEDGDSQEYNASVTILANRAPVASAGGPYTGDEGSPLTLALGGSDPYGDPLTYSWDLGDGTTGSGPTPPASHTYADDGVYTITLTADDGALESPNATSTATIANVAPTLGPLSGPSDPVMVGTSVSVSAGYTDPGTLDTHTASIDWDADGSGAVGAGTAAAGTAGSSHTYTEPGVYAVQLTVSDDDGGSDVEVYEYVVVYDPSAGFVTGGGWIDSPAGAYKPDPSLSGKAHFGFTSRYRKGKTAPSGSTQFQFRAGDMTFHSDVQDWLVVNQGGTNAQFKGTGTINGTGTYTFMIWAGDDSPDTFRIRIWEETGGGESDVYDNGVQQPINGGSIVIHAK